MFIILCNCQLYDTNNTYLQLLFLFLRIDGVILETDYVEAQASCDNLFPSIHEAQITRTSDQRCSGFGKYTQDMPYDPHTNY